MKYLTAWADQYGAARVIRDDDGFRVGRISVVLLPGGVEPSVLHVMFDPDNGDPEVIETYKVELL